jgi:hypothetical protein
MHARMQRMDNMYHRWAPEMETPHLKLAHWRKSSQWAALRRDHAQIIADDTEVTAASASAHLFYLCWTASPWYKTKQQLLLYLSALDTKLLGSGH